MRYLLILLLAGCSTVQPSIMTKYEYVTKQAPNEMYTLAAPVTDGDFTTQRGIADWIIRSEAAYQQCRDKITALQLFFTKESQ